MEGEKESRPLKMLAGLIGGWRERERQQISQEIARRMLFKVERNPGAKPIQTFSLGQGNEVDLSLLRPGTVFRVRVVEGDDVEDI